MSRLGFKDLDYQKGLSRLHEERAQIENERIRSGGLEIEALDDHAIHIDEHTRYFLSEFNQLSSAQKANFTTHVNAHKAMIKEERKNLEN